MAYICKSYYDCQKRNILLLLFIIINAYREESFLLEVNAITDFVNTYVEENILKNDNSIKITFC